MAYRNKVYVCVEYDSDSRYYNTLKMWNKNDRFDFKFTNAHEMNRIMQFSGEEAIKRKLRERLQNTKVMLVLIGERTKFHHKYVVWEIKQALKMDIPIVAVNINKKNGIDNNLCPIVLKGEKILHIPYTERAINYAIEHWPKYYHENAKRSVDTNYYHPMFD